VMHSPLGFPLSRHCELFPEHAYLSAGVDRSLTSTAEISRLAVSKRFRRREGDSLYGGPPRPITSDPSGAEVIDFPFPRGAPEIVSGIYRRLYQESKRQGIEHWIVAMERGLHVVLSRMGFVFAPIGPKVDYFGPVRPYIASIRTLEGHLFRTSPDVFRYMVSGLEPELLPLFARGLAEDDVSTA
jgi:N-acyl amino acid synthase of PEP-CTERM/exosortase system